MTKSKLTAATVAFFLLVGGVSFAASQAGEDGLLSQSWTTMQTASLYQRYKKQNPGEASRLEAYWANGGTVPSITTAFGKALLLEAQAYWSLHGTPTPADTTPPVVSLTSPANGATVSGTIAVAANATDNVGVTKVEFFRDGVVFATDTTSPYSVSFDTATVANGSHTFGPRAYDAAGNATSGTAVMVTVSNTTPPPTTGFPDASNTGVPAGTTLTAYSGPANITTANTVIDGKTIGCIQVSAPGVIIRNSKISCAGGYAVYIDDRTSASMLVTIQDSEIDCKNTPGSAGVGEADFTLLRVEITACENGTDVNQNALIQDSFIHNLYNGGGSHADGSQMACGHWDPSFSGSSCAAGYAPGALNVTFRHNTIFGMGDNDTSFGTSAIIQNGNATDTNVTIDNNLLAGGAYTLYCHLGGPAVNNVITNNHFSTRFKSTVGFYGPTSACSDEAVVSGNVYDETGLPVNMG